MIARFARYLALTMFTLTSLAESAELSFEFVEPEQLEQRLIGILADQKVLDSLSSFAQKSFDLKYDVSFKFYNGDGLFFDSAENDVYVPYGYLHQLYKGAKNKYPEQNIIYEQIFASSVEQLLWFEFSRVLVSQYSMPLRGNEELVLDEFATLMLINFSALAEQFILDAMEAYLLVSDSNTLLYGDSWKSEEIVDRERYALTVCLVIGHDAEGEINGEARYGWSKEKIESCRAQYHAKLQAWYMVLAPYLQESSPIHGIVPEVASETVHTSSP